MFLSCDPCHNRIAAPEVTLCKSAERIQTEAANSLNPHNTEGGGCFNPHNTEGGGGFNLHNTEGGGGFNLHNTEGGGGFNPRMGRTN